MEERAPPAFSHGQKLRRTHIDLLLEWRRTFRTIASGRRRTLFGVFMFDRSKQHMAERSSSWRSVCRPLSPIGESCAVPILISSLNGAALFGRTHQGEDNAYWRRQDSSIDCTRPMTGNGPTAEHCGNRDDDDEDDATTTINAIQGTKGSPACPTAARMSLYVPHEHVVQQGQEILGATGYAG
jgi:hypothetical protein